TANTPFWRRKALDALEPAEWESLCDGCGKCCLHKLEDEDTREIRFTNVACRLLDAATCRCSDYANRSSRVPDCVTLTPEVLDDPYWLPATCAYRLVAEGKDLPDWHPLVSGDAMSVVRSGHSVCGRVVSELDADDLEHHLISWVK
ncbi:MAG: YcgN family cysteine cluster protein, partial [Chromatiales bacterium]